MRRERRRSRSPTGRTSMPSTRASRSPTRRTARGSSRPTSATSGSTSSTVPSRWCRTAASSTRRCRSGSRPSTVQVIGNRVFVAYAKLDENGVDEAPGPGRGYVDVYDLNGNLLGGIGEGRGQLNAPWGLAIAPATWRTFAGDLLVGNFGDGSIDAYREASPDHYVIDGKIRGADNEPLSIDGLWALRFGQGGNNGPAGTLFFTAGPSDEQHGLFGQINPNQRGRKGGARLSGARRPPL